MGASHDRADVGRDDSDGWDCGNVCGRQTLRSMDQERYSRGASQSRSSRDRMGWRLFRIGDEHARSEVAARVDGSRAILSGAAGRQFLCLVAVDLPESVARTGRRAARFHHWPRRAVAGTAVAGPLYKYLFRDDNMLGWSLAITVVLASAVSAALCRATYQSYRTHYEWMRKLDAK